MKPDPGDAWLQLELPGLRGAPQDGGLSHAVRGQREQTAMRRVLGIQHPIVDRQTFEPGAAIGAERQPQVAADAALVDLNGTEPHAARCIVALQTKMSHDVVLHAV